MDGRILATAPDIGPITVKTAVSLTFAPLEVLTLDGSRFARKDYSTVALVVLD